MVKFYRDDFLYISFSDILKTEMDRVIKEFMIQKFGRKLLKKLSSDQLEDFITAMYTLLFYHRHKKVQDDYILKETNEYLSSKGKK